MIKLLNIEKSFNGTKILDKISMEFEEKTITAILGPSGCGKTTLLRIVAGLINADSGEITGNDGKTLSFLFQEPRLLPWKNAWKNLEIVLPDSVDRLTRKKICFEMIEKVGLKGYENHMPAELSGGMRQRLAMARAFIVQADILLMDEPFQSLDLRRKGQMINLFKELWKKQRPLVIMVTHDVQEALLLSDKIYVLSDKPTGILKEIHNPMAFDERNVKNERFYALEKEIISEYVIGE
ncbi:aliphatic sulfonates import ATP-binding protein SsuB 2 [Thermoclostridium stercorarium subsp. stercorarium DSM 8532]|jgi:NitT/TauT family transport system ATP-binding protein|uniref:Aliphatic sulfonates import ATP-binding protein SsuB 2 n=3 Tax=Thermoclostridium stercorarium TaxID=1510 RepID=L7VNF7_THES1|nr:ABC transporter ATP-binding protein [Thermoclostridium stercorarium]AGC68297.1 aliphatic sulfonates import ATP-binding protein SsuB 2 [Thermoclostridium stercorarium subsp. stercorarium DSM 8532]AGI39325.1 ABC transporter ATPase subunit [Thermoclostridium stercorarium subsp. stercorarium DSM 8532]ANW98651.1 aliphatic sulfonate ABC transporter ATP-binding protein [Thermoclostridium stercorarium subsp. thermolacticum DSM 2910]ANX01193.1 aliphatic sulfonate ABC transporter ATP-binding protein [